MRMRGVKRNATVALGNVGSSDGVSALAVALSVERMLESALAGHPRLE